MASLNLTYFKPIVKVSRGFIILRLDSSCAASIKVKEVMHKDLGASGGLLLEASGDLVVAIFV